MATYKTNILTPDMEYSSTRLAHIGKHMSVDSTIQAPTHRMDQSYQPKMLRQVSSTRESMKDHEVEHNPMSKVLVLYTGGTIGMKSQCGVYSPEANYMVPMLRKLPMFHDPNYKLSNPKNKKESEMPLVMPEPTSGRRIIYCVYEYDPLLDSSNMTVDDYANLSIDIKTNYDHFDGFVVLHGTDTMAYTASALAFMLENLGKPVILTGSQIPIFETRSDGRDNFLGALIMAGHYTIPEVAIYFHNALYRGNRSTKKDAGAFDAFSSPNLAPLASLEVNIKVNWNSVFRQGGIKKFGVHVNMCREVGVLRMFPSITLATVKQFLMAPMRGVVLQSYGAGNGPSTRQDIMEALREASNRGVLVVNITQCSRGMVSTSYEAGKALLDSGVIPGSDMTVEAALMKLAYILSKNEWTNEKKRKMVSVNMRGELTIAIDDDKSVQYPLIEKIAKTMKICSDKEMSVLQDTLFPSLLCAAAKEGNCDKLQELMDSGADISLTDYDGRTALHVAACEGHSNAVKFMLQVGASVHIRDRYGHSPLDNAIYFHRTDVIRLLRNTGAILRLLPARQGMLLCNSVKQNDLAHLEDWCLAGADLNQPDYNLCTALHVAVNERSASFVSYLLDHGANPLLEDRMHITALDAARSLPKSSANGLVQLIEHSVEKNLRQLSFISDSRESHDAESSCDEAFEMTPERPEHIDGENTTTPPKECRLIKHASIAPPPVLPPATAGVQTIGKIMEPLPVIAYSTRVVDTIDVGNPTELTPTISNNSKPIIDRPPANSEPPTVRKISDDSPTSHSTDKSVHNGKTL